MSRNATIAIVTGVLLLVAAILAGGHLSRLTDRLAELDQHVEKLNSDVAKAAEHASQAERRADRAEQSALEAGLRADDAIAREQQSQQRAREADQARETAEAEAQQALHERAAAKRTANQAMVALGIAENDRVAAEIDRDQAALDAETARSETARARAELEEVHRRQQAELDRLHLALGQIVETRRTALGVVMSLDSNQIEFDFDRAALRPRNRELLSRIAGVLLTSDGYGLQVFGHTDDVGTVEYNEKLSAQRATVVRDYLVETGISEEIISITAMGKSSPLVEGTDPDSRQRNRRVELALVFSEGEVGDLVDQDG